ncbi:hypothetical protein B0H17DRAFT_1065451 [Mycena rosella]|uniref:Uncharacterized protein n=1 Tax=Mycena rosella TaxID=1033263 RepID=A0AAD7GIV3_MYCRO|nr:hypothetical protein B0H17DRAFT_1065451 [Mycena rosella]
MPRQDLPLHRGGERHSESLDSIGLDVLSEKTVGVSFQLLKLIPATTADDASNKHDWKSAGHINQMLKVLGQMILNPTLLTVQIGSPYYLFESNSLRLLVASLFEQLMPAKRLLIPTIGSSSCFPIGRALYMNPRRAGWGSAASYTATAQIT